MSAGHRVPEWPDRDDLLRDARVRFAETSVAVPDTGNLDADVVELLCAPPGDTVATPIGRAIITAALTARHNDPLRRASRSEGSGAWHGATGWSPGAPPSRRATRARPDIRP
ncbi:Transcriptional regulator, TetR family [Modestobacter italicus]|uniref:Transcriptional regulator, TetR family n=1 Tax=Modestobacter italicus (strain DSM 44449 / CECT 9708 / BC 501) TaxID=2732864 RepID=I4F0M6_MODI5|nr:Transcriptional regulator, TetR family [Modestobacter marinus]